MADFARRKSPSPLRRHSWAILLLVAALGVLVLHSSGGLLFAEEATDTTSASSTQADQTAQSADTTQSTDAAEPTTTSEESTPAQATPPSEEEMPTVTSATAEGAQVKSDVKRNLSMQELADAVNLFDLAELIDPYYEDVLDGWRAAGYRETEGITIKVNHTNYRKSQTDEGKKLQLSSRVQITNQLNGKSGSILMWLDEETTLEWTVNVPKSGLYNIAIEYCPLDGKSSPAYRDLKIDGKYPFNEARRIRFERVYVDAGPPRLDNQGNHIPPQQIEKRIWQTKPIVDQQGMYREPYLFYLSAGTHKISMNAIREPMAIASIKVYSPPQTPSYQNYAAANEAKGYQPVVMDKVQYEFESAFMKSAKTIRAGYGFDPSNSPPSDGKYILNEFGQWRWRMGGDWASWKFTVPEDGLYEIAMKVSNAHTRRLPSTRRIEIDGKVPFKELEEYVFDYQRDPWIEVLQNKDGERFQIYLTKGEHELRMTAMVGPLAHTIRMLRTAIKDMATIGMSITMITGPNPDPNFDWHIDETIPGLLDHIKSLVDRFRAEVDWVRDVAPNNGLADQMEVSAYILEALYKNPDIIPRRLSEFSQQESALGTRILDLQWSPLWLDYFFIAAPGSDYPRVVATPFERLKLGVYNFIMSFRNEYTNIGDVYKVKDGYDEEGNPVLHLWIAYGREWAAIIKEMIDDDFTPQTNIKVNVNVVPGGALDPTGNSSLIMAVASGTAPDLAIGAGSGLPVEFAIRGGVVNLNQYPDYEEVAKRFRPGALVPYKFRGGDYALPDRQGFEMLFYRRDILEALGLKPPQTWDEVRAILPILQQYGMNFNYGGGYLPFLYQNGGDFYYPGHMYSALDTPEALKAFKEWCQLYTNYKVPITANFYNRFRTGESPVGIANYDMYIQLSTAAPELTGWWEMIPIPGHVQPDGTINRLSGGMTAISAGEGGGALSTVGVIFKDARFPDESWELLKWWTSESIQTRFGEELEASIGMEARWNTANMDALRNLPWPRKDVEAILEQWQWLKEQPIVPGGYFTARHYGFAWNKVVLEGVNPREALEKAVKDIDRELRKKREEFGLLWMPRAQFFNMTPEEQEAWLEEQKRIEMQLYAPDKD